MRAIKRADALDKYPIELADPVEAEVEKDVWDFRNIPGSRWSRHNGTYRLNFTAVPVVFRSVTKRYFRLKITRDSLFASIQMLRYLRRFFCFYVARYPQATDFTHLTRQDIEAYLLHLKTTLTEKGKQASDRYRYYAINYLKQFLGYLERAGWQEASIIPVSKLCWREDYPNWSPTRNRGSNAKEIPDHVLEQLDEHLQDLTPPYFQPVVILLRESGWRIGDVLNLRLDTCLQCEGGQWWLQGDIVKTGVTGHRVPIETHIAEIVQAQIALIKEQYTEEENPERYLFPAYKGKYRNHRKQRKGQPLYANTLRDALVRFAIKFDIRDEHGKIFRFSQTHRFRHTKAMDLLNGGMRLETVQKWLAHMTPEMTLVYAKIRDSTMLKEYEQVMRNGALRIGKDGQARLLSPQDLNADRLDLEPLKANVNYHVTNNGYCTLPDKLTCATAFLPCHNCHKFLTTPDWLPNFNKLKQELERNIAQAEELGQAIKADRERQQLDRVLQIIEVLEAGNLRYRNKSWTPVQAGADPKEANDGKG